MLAIKLTPLFFSKMVHDFAEMFAKDNERFDVTRFHEASGYNVPNFTSKDSKTHSGIASQ